MRTPSRLSLVALALVALAMAACSGGSDTVTRGSDGPAVYHAASPTAEANIDPTAEATPTDGGEEFVARTGSPLALSAERSLEPESFRGTFEIAFELGGLSLGMGGEYAFEAPDSMHMTMSLLGETFEMLMVLPDMYVRPPGEGWYSVPTDELGIDWEVYREFVEQRGPFDYSSIVEELKGIEQLPDETIDGVTYLHYGGDLDVDALYDDLPDGILDPGLVDETQGFLGSVYVEVWLHQDTYLPYRLDMTIDLGEQPGLELGGPASMRISMVTFGYGEPVEIPSPPANAPSIETYAPY